MPIDETKVTHVRIRPKTARSLRRMARKARRTINEEANIAAEEYVHRHQYRDNGK